MKPDIPHEPAVVEAFVVPEKRARLRDMLARPKQRSKVLQALNHFRDLDPRFASRIPTAEQSAPQIERLLRERGAPAECHVVAADTRLDGSTMELSAALQAVIGHGRGAIISCVPGRLAYYEGEAPGDRWLLERGAA